MINQDKMQTGRTTRMLEEATNYAIATMAQTVYVVFPQQLIADAMKKIRRPPGDWPSNLRFIGESRSCVTAMDFETKSIELGVEGKFMAFFDHSVIEQQIEQMCQFASVHDAMPGDYGYREPMGIVAAPGSAYSLLQQIIDAYDNVPLRGRSADAPIADKVDHIIKILKGSESQ